MTRNLREHILQTASELFYSQGIKATGIDTIVKASGVAKMSLYKYFPSKDDLVLAHLQRSKESMQTNMLSWLADKDSDPRQKLLAVFDFFEEIMANPNFRGCPFINAAAEFAEQANPIQRVTAEFYTSFRGFLADLATQAGIANAEELASQLSMLIAGAIVREQMQKHSGAMRTATAAAEILIEKSLAEVQRT
jgi:AcrR family transcriptional regulator